MKRPLALLAPAWLCLALLASACATTTEIYPAAEEPPLCGRGVALGRVVVLPQAAWRPDQKDVAEREAMAMRAVREAFAALPCGEAVIEPLGPWAERSEAAALVRAGGSQTLVLLRIYELTPRVGITFSLPFLWGASSEADFSLRVLRVATGAVLLDARVRRSRGGVFQLRPARWAEAELRDGLAELLGASLEDAD